MVTSLLRMQAPIESTELNDALAGITERLGLTRSFPPDARAEAERVTRHPDLPAADRTDVPFLTIDPPGSTDLDQAMFIERLGDGFHVLYAIADVPAFVSPGGAVDAEARRRGQTIYAPDGRIPLHPTVISEDAASLLPDRVRGAFVWDLTLDHTSTVTRAAVARARIRSRRQLTYAEAQDAIDTGADDGGGDGAGHSTLALLKEVGLGRIALERQRGGASLRIPHVTITEDDGSYQLIRRSPLPVEDWNAQISLMTGMAAADLMLGARIGILRTLPEPEEQTIAGFRRQAAALDHPWPDSMPYGEYLRRLDVENPKDLAIMHAAGSLFRGAGYTAFDGSVPANGRQAAVAAHYTHVTAPIRRLVDRFALVACEAISAGEPVPGWVRDALPALPAVMASSDQTAGTVDRAALDTVEAAALSSRVGDIFEATVISGGNGKGMIQLTDPAVTASVVGAALPGTRIRARLAEATIATGSIRFEALSSPVPPA
ncbi:RNB domain-containing ribonuclease [Glaciibacter sp. 2TAF33]|uniref:RNB domain-containing ribonuclease n=1 Tax=Glaciibacter sp. 2TAF33 TaxID=3233015 RepID=UPI003F93D496